MMMLKNLLVGLAMLTLAACGCGDSGGGGGTEPNANDPLFDMTTRVEPCIFPFQPTTASEYQIDIVFDLDDSEFMNRAFGMSAGVPGILDSRSRSVVAQRIFQDVQARLATKLATAIRSGQIPPGTNIDLAFSVVRHEDFGGTIVDYATGTAGSKTPNAGTIDADARPYMLLMPLLREAHGDFDAIFLDAITAQTLGNGNPTLPLQAKPFQDPQSTIESLSQIATGKGIDGNGNALTTDNGVPCSQTATNRRVNAAGVPQTRTAFADVPAVTFQQNGQSAQDPSRPIYLVQDATGAGLPTCISSGNEGGVGFRPQSLRWVIFASDIATVAPFRDAQGLPAAPAAVGTSFTGVSPIPAAAFNGVTGRYGAAGGQPVNAVASETFSPLYATGVQQAMNELVNANIEVMALGALGVQPGQTKPNVPGTDPSRVPAIVSPSAPDLTPFTMESAIAILTGAMVSDTTGGTAPVGPFPAVFNLGTVGLLGGAADPVEPTMANTLPNDDLVDALVERIAARIASTPPIVTNTSTLEPLPELTATLTWTLTEALVDGTTDYVRNSGAALETQSVSIPSWYRDASVNPAQYFQVDVGGNRINTTTTQPAAQVIAPRLAYAYALRDPSLLDGVAPLPINMLGSAMAASVLSITNQTAGNASLVATLRQKPGTLAITGTQIQIQAIRAPEAVPARKATVLSSNGSCFLFRDNSAGLGFFPEESFNCP